MVSLRLVAWMPVETRTVDSMGRGGECWESSLRSRLVKVVATSTASYETLQPKADMCWIIGLAEKSDFPPIG